MRIMGSWIIKLKIRLGVNPMGKILVWCAVLAKFQVKGSLDMAQEKQSQPTIRQYLC